MIDKLLSLLSRVLKELGIEGNIGFKVELSPRPELGDFSTNLAILYARKLSRNPRELAQAVAQKAGELDRANLLEKVEIAGPGFVNFFLKDAYLQVSLLEIEKLDHAFGRSEKGAGEKVLLEFVSANPTGPLHVGHGRWAVMGDVIGRLLDAVGCKVQREYYVNNVGNQVEKLIASIKAKKEGREVPEGGYGGAYVSDLAQKFTLNDLSSGAKAVLPFIIAEQEVTLEKLGVKFDRWFLESDLHEQNKVRMAVEKLHDLRKTFEEGGAIWFKSQEMGDDKNRVLIREDGAPTYFAADIAYHLDKFSRGYDRLINIWGTDHHGYVGRLKAALAAAGQPAEKLEIIIGQLVTLYRGNELVRMSKRTGEMVTLQEVIDEIGKDATRFFFSATDVNSHLDFDLELAKKQSHENPVYYLQYAHARISSIIRKSSPDPRPSSRIDLAELNHPAERELMLKLISWPDVVSVAAALRHPHRVTEYGKELATVFHSFYEKCRVLGNPARMLLVNASRITLRNVLELLGIRAPESM